MNVVSYQSYNTPASHHALLTNFKDFAVSVGWTLDEYQADVAWEWSWPPGSYQWRPGTERFAQLHMHGPNGSFTGVRLQSFAASNGTVTSRRIGFGGFRSTESAYSSASFHRPFVQGTGFYKGSSSGVWAANCLQLSASDISYLKQYMFGNANFLHMIVQYTSVYSFEFFVGLPEFIIYPTGDALMEIRTYHDSTAGCVCDDIGSWYDFQEAYLTLDGVSYAAYPLSKQYIAWSTYGMANAGLNYSPAILPNSFALARPILRDGVVIVDGGVRRLIGYLPFGWAAPSGLQPWQQLTYGGETFIACPISHDGRNNTKKYLVYRIA